MSEPSERWRRLSHWGLAVSVERIMEHRPEMAHVELRHARDILRLERGVNEWKNLFYDEALYDPDLGAALGGLGEWRCNRRRLVRSRVCRIK